VSSQSQNDRYIRATEFAKKHGFEYAKFRLRLTKGEFIAEKRSEYDPISKRHTKRWYVFDAPSADHPNYVETIRKPLTMEGRRCSQHYDARFADMAPGFLRRFQQNANPGKFTVLLWRMIRLTRSLGLRWGFYFGGFPWIEC
jgi:hypothetical protein